MKDEIGQYDMVELVKRVVGEDIQLDNFGAMKDGLNFEVIIPDMINGMILRLKTYVLSEELENRSKVVTIYYDVPENWWEHFKMSLPKWMKLQPKLITLSKSKTVRFRKFATYPKASVLFPESVGTLVRCRHEICEE